MARLAFWVFAGLLVLAISGTGYLAHQRRRYQSEAKRAPGKVVKSMPQTNRGTGYLVHVQYEDERQVPRTFQASVEFYGAAARVGAPTTVVYFPGEPRSGRTLAWLDSNLRFYVGLGFCAALGFFCVLMGKGTAQQAGARFLLFSTA